MASPSPEISLREAPTVKEPSMQAANGFLRAKYGHKPGIWITDPWGKKLEGTPFSRDRLDIVDQRRRQAARFSLSISRAVVSEMAFLPVLAPRSLIQIPAYAVLRSEEEAMPLALMVP